VAIADFNSTLGRLAAAEFLASRAGPPIFVGRLRDTLSAGGIPSTGELKMGIANELKAVADALLKAGQYGAACRFLPIRDRNNERYQTVGVGEAGG
jgi:hypothetical protein